MVSAGRDSTAGAGLPVSLLRRHAALLWGPPLLAGAALAALAWQQPARVAAVLFFLATTVPVLLWLLDGLAGEYWGPRLAAGAGAGLVLLTLAAAALPARQMEVPAALWWAVFASPDETAAHRIRLPLREQRWSEWWRRASGAYVYVHLDNPRHLDPLLDVFGNGERLGRLTLAEQVPGGNPWYRLPVTRELLERSEVLLIEVRPAPGHPYGQVSLYGGYARRPSFGPSPSYWQSPGAAGAVQRRTDDLAPHNPDTQTGRYFFELRFLDGAGWPSVMILY